jgi:hypothetical protein
MKSPLVVLLSLVVLLVTNAPSFCTESSTAQDEISYLIRYIENSGARFIRNGTEHSAREGADHMRDKLKSAGSRVKSAEDFIVGIATKSYLSGKPYLVKLPDGKVVPTGPWLTEALAKYRASKSKV